MHGGVGGWEGRMGEWVRGGAPAFSVLMTPSRVRQQKGSSRDEALWGPGPESSLRDEEKTVCAAVNEAEVALPPDRPAVR